jgi:nucleotide-binding universal stress UspA family protein
MFTELLVPLDGTAEAAIAVRPALTLARATGARMRLVQVTERASGDRSADAAVAAELGLERIAAEVAADGVAVDTEVRRGDAAEQIVAEARRAGADLVVMATHGRSGLGRAVIGSVAEAVLAHSPVPVLLLRPGGHRMTHLRTLLVPLDGTPGGAHALGVALGLARATGARIVLLEVQPPVPLTAYAGDPVVGGAALSYVDPAWDEEARQAAQGYVDRMAERLRHAGVAAEGRAILGDVVATIEATGEDVAADLIVMSTHAHTGPARALLGSVADAVVRTSHRPVLLVRRSGAVRTTPARVEPGAPIADAPPPGDARTGPTD